MPIPMLSGKKGGEISKAILCVQIAPYATMQGFCGRAQIISFTVIVNRHNREIFRRNMSSADGTRIDQETHDFFERLKNKDKVTFTNITIKNNNCYDPNNHLDSIVFTITDAQKYHKTRKPKHGREEVIDPITGEEIIKKW
jgi:hypothetical protein